MQYSLDLSGYTSSPVHSLGTDFSGSSVSGDILSFNNSYLEKNGRPFFLISGECHYSRLSADCWEDEIIKMRMGGINTVSTYVFWNHIEETEGVFDFSGNRDLRRFVMLCARHGLYVILRVGPFAHGEVRNGGLPDWLYGKPFEVRTTDGAFLQSVRRLYEKIGEQVKDLFFKDGGPVIAVQLDNEYMHSSAMWEMTTGVSNEWVFKGNEGPAYLDRLRSIALSSGLTPVFFTATAWGGAAYSPHIMPLWGGYAYWPWIFLSGSGTHPLTPEYLYEDYHHSGQVYADDFTPEYDPATRPYACCEMGGGMTCSYNYRFRVDFRSVDAMANIKVGSGCNFIGYYMFHGGTNPIGKNSSYMNESHVPKRSYDYQAPLGEFGQIRESYGCLRTFHAFIRSFGDRLASMETVLPDNAASIKPEDAETLRFAVRTDGQRGFLFINNFQDHLVFPDRKKDEVIIKTSADTFRFPVSIASGENAVLPFNFDMDGIVLRQACAQPVLKTLAGGRILYVFLIPDGLDGSFCFSPDTDITGTGTVFTVRQGNLARDVLVLTRQEANRLYCLRDGSLIMTDQALLEDADGSLRLETTQAENLIRCYPPERLESSSLLRLADDGIWGVYAADTALREITPVCVRTSGNKWTIDVPKGSLNGLKDALLQIRYQGDIGSLFLQNEMISDNFCNGDVFETSLISHKDALDTQSLVLNIAPLRQGATVNVISAMAGRSESVESEIANLESIRVQPVYEISLTDASMS